MVDSHIQMPKLLLKKFHNEYKQFYYYDVKKKCIGNRGQAKSLNTECGYYSEETEKYLEKEIETPFSKILKYLEDVGIKDKNIVSINSEIIDSVFNFMYALVVRAPSFQEQLAKDDNDISNLLDVERRDRIIRICMDITKESGFFDDFIFTFLFNNTEIPFVLSMDGIYNYTLNGHLVINLPILPNIAICLVHKNYADRIIYKDGSVSMFTYDRPEDIMIMNHQAFLSQIKHEWGYVVCPQRAELERLLNENT